MRGMVCGAQLPGEEDWALLHRLSNTLSAKMRGIATVRRVALCIVRLHATRRCLGLNNGTGNKAVLEAGS